MLLHAMFLQERHFSGLNNLLTHVLNNFIKRSIVGRAFIEDLNSVFNTDARILSKFLDSIDNFSRVTCLEERIIQDSVEHNTSNKVTSGSDILVLFEFLVEELGDL